MAISDVTGLSSAISGKLDNTDAAAGALIAGASGKVTPVDGDSLALSDSAAGAVLKKLTWANLKAALSGIFAKLSGIAGGQTLIGGAAASENLTLQSTSHATRGKLIVGTSAYDEATNRLGVGVNSPTAALHLKAGTASAATAPLKLQDGTLLTTPESGAIEQSSGRLYHTDSSTVRRAIATESFVAATEGNLLINGAGEMLNNRNFSGYTFDQVDTYATPGSFRVNVANVVKRTDDLISVDTTQRLRCSLWAKSGDIGGGNFNAANKQYFGIEFFDLDGKQIDSAHGMKTTGAADTTLASALNPGDTTITLTDATGWYNSTNAFKRGFSWFGYANSKGYVYPDYTYTRNRLADAWDNGGISGNVITLKTPWAGPALAAGAAVRNTSEGGTFNSIILSDGIVPNTWTRYEGYLSGSGSSTNNYRWGTAFVKLGHLVNYHGSADNNVRIADVRFSNFSSANLESQIGVGATYKDIGQSSLPTNGLVVEGKIGSGTSAPGAQIHALATTEQCRLGYDASNYISQTVGSAGQYSLSLVGTAANAKLSYSDASTSTVYDLLTLSKNSSGTGAAGLGARLILAAKSSTTSDTAQGSVEASWATATHASRKGRLTLSAYDTAIREGVRVEASGSAPMLGFFGVTAVVRPTALTATVAAAPAGGTGTAAGGWDTAANRDLAIATINNLKTRVDQLESKLQALGLLT